MREFPTPVTVYIHRFEATEPEGNQTAPTTTWNPAKDEAGDAVKVIAVAPMGVNYEPESDRTVLKLEMYIPPILRDPDGEAVGEPKFMDLIDVAGIGQCDVLGVRDYTQGFHGWQAGKVVDLERTLG